MGAMLLSPSVLEQKKKEKGDDKKRKNKKAFKGGSLPSSSHFGSRVGVASSTPELRVSSALAPTAPKLWLCSCSGFAPIPIAPRLWLCSHYRSAFVLLPLQQLLGSGDGMRGRRWEVGGKNFGAEKRRKKNNNFGQGGCSFGSSPKWLERPHPQLNWWWRPGSLQPIPSTAGDVVRGIAREQYTV